MSQSFPNVNALWSAVIANALTEAGVETVIISPGSRSTPLVCAFTSDKRFTCHAILDERSAAFFALGVAKASGKPVALLCTSGTAGANYYPAIIEARMSGAKLIALTADRPPELRNCHSGQTIDQQNLFGRYVHAFIELPLPEISEKALVDLRNTVTYAARPTLRAPVQINIPFRDPLPPIDEGQSISFDVKSVFKKPLQEPEKPDNAFDLEPLRHYKRGLIITSYSSEKRFTEKVAAIADYLGWPVLSDGLNQLRNNADRLAYPIFHYEAILRSQTCAEELLPQAVLQIGSVPTSKSLRAWLQNQKIPLWVVSENGDDRNALKLDQQGQSSQLPIAPPSAAEPSEYAQRWVELDQKAAAALNDFFASEESLYDGKAAWLLAKHIPEGSDFFTASSLAVRYVEYFWTAQNKDCRMFSNRGANGIDGTLSTAMGIASEGRPTYLLTGDLALLHDSNGFLNAANFTGSLTIILINNDGGGIFEYLPIHQIEPPFEDFFATPQAIDFEKLADLHSIAYERIESYDQFIKSVSKKPIQGIRLLEVRTNRKQDQRITKDLLNKTAEAL